jgi:hypothetical protein
MPNGTDWRMLDQWAQAALEHLRLQGTERASTEDKLMAFQAGLYLLLKDGGARNIVITKKAAATAGVAFGTGIVAAVAGWFRGLGGG